MPWKVVEGGQNCPFEVVKSDTGEHVACHQSREEASAHMKALYANTEEEMMRAQEPYGDVKYADPGYRNGVKRYPIDTETHARAAWSYINQPDNARLYSAEQLSAIKGRIKAALRKFGVEVSEDRQRYRDDERAPVEFRSATLAEVNYAQRLVTIIAVPYEQPTPVPFRGAVWDEIHHRGAYDGLEKRPGRVRVNRDHDRSRTVGKAVKFSPDSQEGLLAEIRIAHTVLGDETLALADEDCLSNSVGFAVKPSGQVLDQFTKTRHINTAYLDHIAFVESPAFVGARVLSVRGTTENAAQKPSTPHLDRSIAEMHNIMAWAAQRLNRVEP